MIDLYSVKPIDLKTFYEAVLNTKAMIIVEDHFAEGGIGEAVGSALRDQPVPVCSLAVRKIPKSGKTRELLDYEEISGDAIIKKVKELLIVLPPF